MKPGFAASMTRLWSIAARHLGWRPDEFWAATPAELWDAFADTDGTMGHGIDRAEFQEMMERDHDR